MNWLQQSGLFSISFLFFVLAANQWSMIWVVGFPILFFLDMMATRYLIGVARNVQVSLHIDLKDVYAPIFIVFTWLSYTVFHLICLLIWVRLFPYPIGSTVWIFPVVIFKSGWILYHLGKKISVIQTDIPKNRVTSWMIVIVVMFSTMSGSMIFQIMILPELSGDYYKAIPGMLFILWSVCLPFYLFNRMHQRWIRS